MFHTIINYFSENSSIFWGGVGAIGTLVTIIAAVPKHRKRNWYSDEDLIINQIISLLDNDRLFDPLALLDAALNGGDQSITGPAVQMIRDMEERIGKLRIELNNHNEKYPGKSIYLQDFIFSSEKLFNSLSEYLCDLRTIVNCFNGIPIVSMDETVHAGRNSQLLCNLMQVITDTETDSRKAVGDLINIMFGLEGIPDYSEQLRDVYSSFKKKDTQANSSILNRIHLSIRSRFDDPDSQYQLGMLYYQIGDNNKAGLWLKKASNNGVGIASYQLAGMADNTDERLSLYQTAYNQGYSRAAIKIAFMRAFSTNHSREDASKEIDESIALIEGCKNNIDTDYYLYSLGSIYMSLKHDNHKALEYFEQSGAADSPSYYGMLNLFYKNNLHIQFKEQGTEDMDENSLRACRDELIATHSFFDSYSLKENYAEAKSTAYTIIMTLISVFKALAEYDEAMEWCKKAAASPIGEKSAWFAYVIGYYYDHGLTKEGRNNSLMAYWFQKSYKFGYPLAMEAMGICYMYGKGVNQDMTKGRECFEQAMVFGIPGAYFQMFLYMKRTHPDTPPERFEKYLIPAIKLKYAPAYYEYALIREGHGKTEIAAAFFIAAAQLGLPEAITACKERGYCSKDGSLPNDYSYLYTPDFSLDDSLITDLFKFNEAAKKEMEDKFGKILS